MIQEFDVEQWLEIWKEAGLKINPKTAEVEWRYHKPSIPMAFIPICPRNASKLL